MKKNTIKDGAYFTAQYNKKNIRGILTVLRGSSVTYYTLCNNTFGKPSKCAEDTEMFLMSYEIAILSGARESDKADVAFNEELGNQRITNFQIVTNKSIIRQIENDRMPYIGEYSATLVKGKTRAQDQFRFGCGEVTLDRKQVRAFTNVIRAINACKSSDRTIFFDVLGDLKSYDMSLEDVELQDLQKLLDA